MVRHLRPPGPAAWPCRCPCPGRRPSSPPTRSRPHPGGRASATRPSDFPDAVAPTEGDRDGVKRYRRHRDAHPVAGPRRHRLQLARQVVGWPPVTVTRAKEPAGGTGRPGAGEVDQLALAGAPGQHGRVPPADALHQHLLGPPDPGLVAGQRGAIHHRPEPLEALGDHLGGHEFVVHGGGPGSGAGREDEGVGAVVGGLGATSSVSSKSSSVSPGKPTMMSVVTARSSMAARAAASRSR